MDSVFQRRQRQSPLLAHFQIDQRDRLENYYLSIEKKIEFPDWATYGTDTSTNAVVNTGEWEQYCDVKASWDGDVEHFTENS